MSPKERKDRILSDLGNRFRERVLDVVEPVNHALTAYVEQVERDLTNVSDDLSSARSEAENEIENLTNHVDELESEFRHEVHELQDNNTNVTEDDVINTVSDYIRHNSVEDELDLNNNTEFSELKEQVSNLTDALSSVGEATRYL